MEKGTAIQVLDKGYVRYIDHSGSDQRILESARISYKSSSKGEEKDKKLLNYLYKNFHHTPFEMCNITFNIKLPIFVMRQLVRHRTGKINEVSARYTELKDDFYIPKKWRKQDTKNKQGSVVDESSKTSLVWAEEVYDDEKSIVKFEDICNEIYGTYCSMIKGGISREMARMILPTNIYTEIYWNMDLRNLLNFIRLREDAHAQYEIQEYAKAIKKILQELYPWTMQVYEEHEMKFESKFEASKSKKSV